MTVVIRDVNFYDGHDFQGQLVNLSIMRDQWKVIFVGDGTIPVDGVQKVAIPALVDPHVHFRTPGQERIENWVTGTKAAISGGYTTVLDMPNNIPSCSTEAALTEKEALVRAQIEESGFKGFQYGLYFGADRLKFDEIEKVKNRIVAIKVYMGSSTGNLLMDDEPSLRKLFEIAKKFDILVAVHAEDEAMIKTRANQFKEKKYCDHSEIRSPEVAIKATRLAIKLMKEIGNRLYIVHVSTKGEIDLIKAAKKEGYPIYAETTPHHLFLNTGHYRGLQGCAKMNPPLRRMEENEALWQAINEGVIDTIGSDHAPHKLEDKKEGYDKCPSGVPGIETTLRLLLDAHSKRKITMQKIVELTSINPRKIFRLKKSLDIVVADLEQVETVQGEKLHTKCKWSPFEGMALKGMPIITVLNGRSIVIKDL